MKLLVITTKTGETKGLYKITAGLLNKIKKVSKNIEIKTAAETDPDVNKKLAWAEILITSEFGMLSKENAQNLRWVHLTSAGTNKLPDFVINSNMLITNSSGVHPVPIAEHVFGLMLMLARKIYKAHKVQILEKKWQRSYEYFSPDELFGKNLLIVGMGRIGERIAQIAKAFGMQVNGVVRDLKKKRQVDVKLYAMKDLKKAVKNADFIVNALPGTEHTKNIFNLDIFKLFKPDSYFINIGRGTSVAEKDMVQALKKGIIAGAGLDVFEAEPLSEKSELWNLENVIITPHYSGWTPKYTERVIDIFIRNLEAYLKNKPMPNLVNKVLGY